MDNLIKITPDLNISFFDLLRPVDTNSEFTLRDVLRACVNSEYIPLECMQEILQCRCLKDFYDEAESKPFENSENDIEYLELYYQGDIGEDKDSPDGKYFSGKWAFHGVGKLGVVPDEDVMGHMSPEDKANFRQSYAIELSPMYNLTDYKIKIRKEILITDWTDKNPISNIKRIDFQHPILLVEVLYWVIWELSFFGSPKDREEESSELKRRCNEIDQAKKDGTLDKLLIPWEDVKKDLCDEFGWDEDDLDGSSDLKNEKKNGLETPETPEKTS